MARRPRNSARGPRGKTANDNKKPDNKKPDNKKPDNKKPEDPAVFYAKKDDKCAACAGDVERGEWIALEGDKPVCLSCADFDHLAFLPRGDAALTRRATKHSSLRVLVLEWNRRRKRFERQGILVEAEAIEKAEDECAADADERAARRVQAAARREVEDAAYIERFTAAIRESFPGCPPDEAKTIAGHACRKHSGRVGRSAAAKELDARAVTLAVRAHIRHGHTSYDALLAAGEDRAMARHLIAGDLDAVAARWKQPA